MSILIYHEEETEITIISNKINNLN